MAADPSKIIDMWRGIDEKLSQLPERIARALEANAVVQGQAAQSGSYDQAQREALGRFTPYKKPPEPAFGEHQPEFDARQDILRGTAKMTGIGLFDMVANVRSGIEQKTRGEKALAIYPPPEPPPPPPPLAPPPPAPWGKFKLSGTGQAEESLPVVPKPPFFLQPPTSPAPTTPPIPGPRTPTFAPESLPPLPLSKGFGKYLPRKIRTRPAAPSPSLLPPIALPASSRPTATPPASTPQAPPTPSPLQAVGKLPSDDAATGADAQRKEEELRKNNEKLDGVREALERLTEILGRPQKGQSPILQRELKRHASPNFVNAKHSNIGTASKTTDAEVHGAGAAANAMFDFLSGGE